MKFLVDMNLSPSWVGFLVQAGFEAIHWSNVGPGDAPDAELMRWAADHGHVVLTSDLGYGASWPQLSEDGRASCRFAPMFWCQPRLG